MLIIAENFQALLLLNRIPVSYTHLDVYKRQVPVYAAGVVIEPCAFLVADHPGRREGDEFHRTADDAALAVGVTLRCHMQFTCTT